VHLLDEIVVVERREVEFLFFSVFDFCFVVHDDAPDSDQVRTTRTGPSTGAYRA
jgi:hypothetical protein